MKPEFELLLICASPYPNPDQLHRLGALLETPLNWPEIMTLAAGHGLSQLLYNTMQQIDPAAIPADAAAELRQRFDTAVRRNLFRTGELLRLLNLFAATQIQAVPFKGPALAEKLYGSLALRVFDDLDILIHRQDVEQAKSLMLADGYTRKSHEGDNAYQFIKADKQFIVEVHWQAVGFGVDWLRKLRNKPLPVELEQLLPRLQETIVGGRSTPIFAPEDTLLILCMHGSKHWWRRLNWLSDIAALLHVYPNLDWSWIIHQTNTWGVRRMVFLGLFLAHELLQARLPDNIWAEVKAEPQVRKLAILVQTLLFVKPDFRTTYMKRPAYFRQLWDSPQERRVLYADHILLYMNLLSRFVKNQLSREK